MYVFEKPPPWIINDRITRLIRERSYPKPFCPVHNNSWKFRTMMGTTSSYKRKTTVPKYSCFSSLCSNSVLAQQFRIATSWVTVMSNVKPEVKTQPEPGVPGGQSYTEMLQNCKWSVTEVQRSKDHRFYIRATSKLIQLEQRVQTPSD